MERMVFNRWILWIVPKTFQIDQPLTTSWWFQPSENVFFSWDLIALKTKTI